VIDDTEIEVMFGLVGAPGSALRTVELFAVGRDDDGHNGLRGIEIILVRIRCHIDLLTGGCGTAAPMEEGPYLEGLRLAAELAETADDVSSFLKRIRLALGPVETAN
jgi:hypothetical protein